MNARTSTIVFALMAIAWVVIIGRAYVFKKEPGDFVITVTQSQVQAFARAELIAIQQRSFDDGIELCGIVFENSEGELGATRPREGSEASCGIAYFDQPGMRPVASFHTHGGYNTDYDSEVPSILDLESDASSGMDGYVATPGGRFWRVDASGPTAINVCGAGCLPQDPLYQPCPASEPKSRYTYRALSERQLGPDPGC